MVFVTLAPMNVALIQRLLFISTLFSALVLPALLPLERNLAFILLWNTGITIGLVMLLAQIKQTKQVQLSWLTSYLAMVVVAIALQNLQSITPLISLWGHSPWYEGVALYSMLCITTFLISQQCSQTKESIISSITVSIVLVAAYCVLQWLHVDPLQPLWQQQSLLGRSFSVFDRPATAAQFLLIGLPFLITKPAKPVIKIVAIALVCIGIATTGSRSSLLGLLGIAAIYAVIQRKNYRTIPQLSVLIIIAAGLMFVASTRFTQENFLRSFGSRLEIANVSVHTVIQKPLGYGVSTFAFASQPNLQATIYEYEPLLTKLDKAHSVGLDILLQVGIITTLAIGLLWSYILYTLYKTKQYPLLMSLVGISISLLFDFASAPILILLAVMLGLNKDTLTTAAVTLKKHSALLLVVILCFISAYTTTNYRQWAQSSTWAQRAQLHEATNSAKALLKYEYAIKNWANDPYILQPAIEFALQNHNYIEGTLLDNWLIVAMNNTNGYDATTISLAGWRELQRGNKQAAEQYFAKATQIAPFAITPRVLQLFAFKQLGDVTNSQRIKNEIQVLLPTEWNKTESNRRRILLKENAWLQEFN